MRRVVRLTESDITRIVRRVVNESRYLNESYEPGDTFKAGSTTYTIGTVGTMDCKFTIQITGGGKTMNLDANTINNVQDANLKLMLQGIMKAKLKEAGC